jgi:hypothetical protein
VSELPILPGLEAARIQAPPPSPAKAEHGSTPSISFEILLERLREKARALEATAQAPLNAQELPGAVHDAQASLQDALKLADGLVEAYRSSRIRRAGY